MSDRNGARRPSAKDAKRFWGGAEEPEEAPERVHPTEEPDALVRFLGPPSLPGHETAAQHYFAVVYDKAVGLAGALAAAGGLLDDDRP